MKTKTKGNITIQVIAILLCCFTNYLNGQEIELIIDPSIKVNKIFPRDTVMWSCTDSLDIDHLTEYPINCNVKFDDHIILHTCTFFKNEDSYLLRFYKISFGLQILLEIGIKDQKLFGKLQYDESNFGVKKEFKIENCVLRINKDLYESGKEIQGNIILNFIGDYYSPESENYIERQGTISGEFHVEMIE